MPDGDFAVVQQRIADRMRAALSHAESISPDGAAMAAVILRDTTAEIFAAADGQELPGAPVVAPPAIGRRHNG